MHTRSLLDAWLRRNCSFIHRARLKALVKLVDSLLVGGKATVAELGRNMRTLAYEKHAIKCADRLIGNRHLAAERMAVYRVMAQWLLGATTRPWIIVDWSDVELGHDYLMLKAAVPVGGRAVSIYEEVHPLKLYNNPKVHRRFLDRLSSVVPSTCRPIVITDAGFRGPWFAAVEALGWDWIGRVRNEVKYCRDGVWLWKYTRSLYSRATHSPLYVGKCWLSAKSSYPCYLHLYKALKRGPGRPRRPTHPVPHHQRQRRHAREPWLLATSLTPHTWSARRVVRAYEKRMQIEETFRDLKSHRWGYGLQYARSHSVRRLENLLLITTLATLATWLVGLAAKTNDWTRHFQANTESRKPVLSLFFLGRRVLRSLRFVPSKQDLADAIAALPDIVYRSAQHA